MFICLNRYINFSLSFFPISGSRWYIKCHRGLSVKTNASDSLWNVKPDRRRRGMRISAWPIRSFSDHKLTDCQLRQRPISQACKRNLYDKCEGIFAVLSYTKKTRTQEKHCIKRNSTFFTVFLCIVKKTVILWNLTVFFYRFFM